jgi:hypothetical protein
MEKFSDPQKRRIKNALKIMRESSGVKCEIIRDMHGMDPSHVENGDTFPTMATIINYSVLCSRCPGWMLLLSCQVDSGKITESEFYEIIKNWDSHKKMAEMKTGELINMIRGGFGG